MDKQSKKREDKVDHVMSEPVETKGHTKATVVSTTPGIESKTHDLPKEAKLPRRPKINKIPVGTVKVGSCLNCRAPIYRHTDTGVYVYNCKCELYFRDHC